MASCSTPSTRPARNSRLSSRPTARRSSSHPTARGERIRVIQWDEGTSRIYHLGEKVRANLKPPLTVGRLLRVQRPLDRRRTVNDRRRGRLFQALMNHGQIRHRADRGGPWRGGRRPDPAASAGCTSGVTHNVQVHEAGPVRAAGRGAITVAHDAKSELGIEYYIGKALLRQPQPDAILILLDADEDCPRNSRPACSPGHEPWSHRTTRSVLWSPRGSMRRGSWRPSRRPDSVRL